MRKALILLLPILVVGVFLFLKFFTNPSPKEDLGRVPLGGGIEIEERAAELLKQKGSFGENMLQLQPVSPDQNDIFGAVGWTQSGNVTTLTVTALLPDKERVQYQAWLKKEQVFISMGYLKKEKAGYILDYILQGPLSAYSEIVISEERVFDNTLENLVLAGKIR